MFIYFLFPHWGCQSHTDQYEGGIAIRETAHHTGTVADLPVQPFNNIISVDVSPVFGGKITISNSLLNSILYFLSDLSAISPLPLWSSPRLLSCSPERGFP